MQSTAMRSQLSQAKELGISCGWWGASFIYKCKSLSPSFSIQLSPLLLSPQILLLSDPTGTPCWRARVRVSCVVLSETIRIVSKLTHTTNVGGAVLLGAGLCKLLLARSRAPPPPRAPRSARGAGSGRGGDRGRPLGVRAPPLSPSFPSGPQ